MITAIFKDTWMVTTIKTTSTDDQYSQWQETGKINEVYIYNLVARNSESEWTTVICGIIWFKKCIVDKMKIPDSTHFTKFRVGQNQAKFCSLKHIYVFFWKTKIVVTFGSGEKAYREV